MKESNLQNTTNQNSANSFNSINSRQSQIPQITKINDGIAGFLVAKSLWMAAKNLVNFFFAAPKEEKNNAIEDVEKGEESKESKQLFIFDSYHSIDVERNPEKSFDTIRKTNDLIEKNPQDSAAYFDRGCAYFDLAVKFKHHQNDNIVQGENKKVLDFIDYNLGIQQKVRKERLMKLPPDIQEKIQKEFISHKASPPVYFISDIKVFKAAINRSNADFDKALEFDKNNVEILLKKGLLNYITKENQKLARESFVKALEIDPKTKLANHYLGLILFNYGKFDEEKQIFSKNNDHRAKSEEFFKKEVEINPNSNSYEQLGRIKLEKAMYRKNKEVAQNIIEEARQDFYKALELNPATKSINFYIGKSYLAEEKPNEALAFFEAEIANRPSKEETYFINAKSFFEIAKINQTQGNHVQAVENLKRAAKEFGDKKGFVYKIFELADISYLALNKTKEEKNKFIIKVPLGGRFEKEYNSISLQEYLDGAMKKTKKPVTSTKLESFKKLSPNQQTNSQTTHF